MSVADGSPGATRRKGFTYWGLPRPKSTTEDHQLLEDFVSGIPYLVNTR